MHALVLFLSNGILFWILVKLLPGIEVQGLFAALIAPVVFSLISIVLDTYEEQINWMTVLEYIINTLQGLRDYLKEPPVKSQAELGSYLRPFFLKIQYT